MNENQPHLHDFVYPRANAELFPEIFWGVAHKVL